MESEWFGFDVLDRIERAIEAVRNRQARATAVLQGAGVWHALAGGNAAAAWVATADESAVRNTPDVVVMVRREDAATADAALRTAGFTRVRDDRADLFLDAPIPADQPFEMLARKAVRLLFAAAGDPPESVELAGTRVLSLDALVRMELAVGRTLNKVHVRDLIAAELIDASWCDRLPPPLADRLRELLADPDG
jgi:hypothetical protein